MKITQTQTQKPTSHGAHKSSFISNAREVQLKPIFSEEDAPILVLSDQTFAGSIRVKIGSVSELNEQLVHPFTTYPTDQWLYMQFFANDQEFLEQECLPDSNHHIQVIRLSNPERYPRLVKRMVMFRLWQQFDRANRTFLHENPGELPPFIISQNFVQELEVYVRLDATDVNAVPYRETQTIQRKRENGIQPWRKFTIRFNQQRFEVPFSISIAHNGLKHSLVNSLTFNEALNAPHSRFVYNGTIVKQSKLHELPSIATCLVPFISQRELKSRGFYEAKSSKRNTISEDSSYVQALVSSYVMPLKRNDTVAPFQLSKPISFKPHQILHIDPKQGELVFGQGKRGSYIKRMIMDNGPAGSISTPHHLILIYKDTDRAKISEFLTKTKADFARMCGISFKKDYHIMFTDATHAEALLQENFSKMSPKQVSESFAFVLQPVSTSVGSFGQDDEVYVAIKNRLLQFGIASQAVRVDRHSDRNYAHFIPNFAVGSNAKLGGVPWKLAHPLSDDDLVIGISMFRSKRDKRMYFGFAFGFSVDGKVQHVDHFEEQEVTRLAGAIRMAIKGYFNNDTRTFARKPKRLVLHVYKQLSSREMRSLFSVLHELDLDVEVYIVTIYQQYYNDIFVTNEERDDKVVVNGTAFQLDSRSYLLQINDLLKSDQSYVYSYLRQIKVDLRAGTKETLITDEIKKHLLTQVYQFSRLNYRSVFTQAYPVTVLFPKWLSEKMVLLPDVIVHESMRQRLWFL